MRSARNILPILALAILPTLFLWKLTLAGRILVGLDPFNFFYPYHDALRASLAMGRLAEWNPALFGGAPFLADSQAQLFYPLGWPFLALAAPMALTWGAVLHLALAAVGTYLWARLGLGLERWGSWVAGALFTLGGYLGAQIEHLNQVQAAAWLPWLLLGYELGRTRGGGARREGVALGALALGLGFLAGHAQTTFISLLLLALWALWGARRDLGRVKEEMFAARSGGLYLPVLRVAGADFLRVNFLPLLLILLLGTLLAAVQLLPTQQLAQLSPRAGGLPFREAASFSLDPRVLPRALLPTFGLDEPLLSEYVAWVGFIALALALLGALATPRRAAREFGLLAAGTGLFLAFGGYNPLFWLLWRLVPGFDLFRAPARWLLLWAFGLALLAGAGFDRLLAGGARPFLPGLLASLRRSRRGHIALLLGSLFLALLLLFGAWPPLAVLPWWVGGSLLALAILVLAPAGGRPVPRLYPFLVVTLLLGELWAGSWGQRYQEATAPGAYLDLRPVPAHLVARQSELNQSRLLSISDLTWDPGDLAALQARHASLLPEEAIYDLVVATKLKEILAPNQPMRWGLRTADGYGGGLLPSDRWVTFQEVLPLEKLVPDGRLREQLKEIPPVPLLDIMGVEWLVLDKVDDWWSEDVYHDLGAPFPLEAGRRIEWEVGGWELTALSFIVIGEWPEEPGQVRVGERRLSLGMAEERARRETGRGVERQMVLPLDPPVRTSKIELLAEAPWTLGSLSLVDGRLPAFQSMPANPALQGTFSGDVKVYRRRDFPGRAWVVPEAIPVEDAAAAARAIAAPTFDPGEHVVVEQAEGRPLPTGGRGTVRWLQDDPNHITLRVSVPEGGWLLLADAPFPGWRVRLNGEERAASWLPANVINRALFLPPGEHLVEWEYRTPALAGGVAGTLLGLFLLGAWLLVPRRR